jgi:hypothetical protein
VLGAIGTKEPGAAETAGAAFETTGVGVEVGTKGVLVGVSLTKDDEFTGGVSKSLPKSGNSTVGIGVGVEFSEFVTADCAVATIEARSSEVP